MNKKLKQPLRNQDVRAAIKEAGLCHWWVAEELGVAPGTLTSWLRKELLPEEREKILAAVRRRADRLGSPEASRPEMTLEARASFSKRGW